MWPLGYIVVCVQSLTHTKSLVCELSTIFMVERGAEQTVAQEHAKKSYAKVSCFIIALIVYHLTFNCALKSFWAILD